MVGLGRGQIVQHRVNSRAHGVLWPPGLPERRRTPDWCAIGRSCRAPLPVCTSTPHTTTGCHGDNIRSRDVRPAQARAATLDRGVHRLNRGFFIHTEHRRVLRRVYIQADDVGRFFLEAWIVRGHIAVQSMRLQARLRPDPLHGVLAQL